MRRDRFVTVFQDGEQVSRYDARVGWNPIPYGVRAFVRYLRGRTTSRDSIATPDDGIRALQIADATYRSARRGRVVKPSEV